MSDLDIVLKKKWDVIVIGTGMGGATLGHELARAGKDVLFCDKGKSHLSNDDSLRGKYGEEFFDLPETRDKTKAEIMSQAGRWSDEIEDQTGKRPKNFMPFAGAGAGGSSTLYGMVMQRFSPDDFAPKSNFPDVPGADIPEAWPISYEDLKPYYRKVEEAFRVWGQIDPLRKEFLDPIPPRPFIPKDGISFELFQHFQNKGMHPYQPPLACDLISDCLHCQGFICPKNCKNDSAKIYLKPTIERYGATLLDECRALKLEADTSDVKGVVCKRHDKKFFLKGKLIILAAGALETPNILLHSTNSDWPNGLANNSGLVGRNLMRNLYDLYFLFPNNKTGIANGLKELYLTDFYTKEAGKLGIIQSFGHMSPCAMLEGIENDVENSTLAFLIPIFKRVKPNLFRYITRKIYSTFILVSTMEDMPYHENKIIPSSGASGRIAFQYSVHNFDKDRISILRRKVKEVLRPYRFFLLKQAEQNKNFIALACGTCRFGHDPMRSVLDPDNRAHGLQNLYVVDSSFFPTNPGLNSGLTIAANALRVADKVLKKI